MYHALCHHLEHLNANMMNLCVVFKRKRAIDASGPPSDQRPDLAYSQSVLVSTLEKDVYG
jgi:hypothetical protein